MSIRYYVHGDESEQSLDVFFCSICDSFEPKAHFEEPMHIRRAKEKIDATTLGLKRLKSSVPRKYRRPRGPKNVFKLNRHLGKSKTSPFYRWLLRQRERDDPIGDLACDAERDRKFPKNSQARNTLRTHLSSSNAQGVVFAILDEALHEFRQSHSGREPIAPKLRFQILKRDGYRCQLCGASSADSEAVRLEIDHKVSVAKGGSNGPENLWTLCRECNAGKGSSDL